MRYFEAPWFPHELENMENGKTFSSQGKVGKFEQTRKVGKIEGILASFYFDFFSDF